MKHSEMEDEALRIIALRDQILQEDTVRSRRLALEKKIRADYAQKSQYNGFQRKGRYDLIDEQWRKKVFARRAEIDAVFDTQYSTRVKRIDEQQQQHQHQHHESGSRSNERWGADSGAVAIGEDFYDDVPIASSAVPLQQPQQPQAVQHPVSYDQMLRMVQSQQFQQQFQQQPVWPMSMMMGYMPYGMGYNGITPPMPQLQTQVPQPQQHQQQQTPQPPPQPQNSYNHYNQ